MQKVIRDRKVAVLYSPGYGAGWYSWNESCQECLFSPEIVALVEKKEPGGNIEEKAIELFGERFYPGGADQLRIEWMPIGTHFKITEYDGYERIEYLSDISLIA
jgi:hypothetical protein